MITMPHESALTSPPVPRRSVPPRPIKRHRPLEWRHVISEELFGDSLVREHMRADRFEESFVLLLVFLTGRVKRDSGWADVIEALSDMSLATDLIGWLERGAVIGLIRSLAGEDPHDAASALASSVKDKLVNRLPRETSERCSIRLEIYSARSDSTPLVFADGARPQSLLPRVVRRAAKRLLDVVGSAVFLALFSPLYLLLSLLVKLTSRGPVFYRQERVGERGRLFTMLKFRTMAADADPKVHQQYVESFIRGDVGGSSGTNSVFKIVDDPRVTPLGHFLRRTSLDELPQFWNVLKGEMSLVGPRPPLRYEVDRYKHWHRRRVLEAPPGITGLWQVTGRSRTTFDEMVRLDLQYATHHSVWTDVKILLATPRAVISGKGAH